MVFPASHAQTGVGPWRGILGAVKMASFPKPIPSAEDLTNYPLWHLLDGTRSLHDCGHYFYLPLTSAVVSLQMSGCEMGHFSKSLYEAPNITITRKVWLKQRWWLIRRGYVVQFHVPPLLWLSMHTGLIFTAQKTFYHPQNSPITPMSGTATL